MTGCEAEIKLFATLSATQTLGVEVLVHVIGAALVVVRQHATVLHKFDCVESHPQLALVRNNTSCTVRIARVAPAINVNLHLTTKGTDLTVAMQWCPRAEGL